MASRQLDMRRVRRVRGPLRRLKHPRVRGPPRQLATPRELAWSRLLKTPYVRGPL